METPLEQQLEQQTLIHLKLTWWGDCASISDAVKGWCPGIDDKKDVKKMEETLYQRRRLQREEDCERHPSVGEGMRGRQRALYTLSIHWASVCFPCSLQMRLILISLVFSLFVCFVDPHFMLRLTHPHSIVTSKGSQESSWRLFLSVQHHYGISFSSNSFRSSVRSGRSRPCYWLPQSQCPIESSQWSLPRNESVWTSSEKKTRLCSSSFGSTIYSGSGHNNFIFLL